MKICKPEYGLELTEVEHGVKVSQHGKWYMAKGWRLSPEVVSICEQAFAFGLVCMIRNGHPKNWKLCNPNETVDYLGFSLCPNHHWVFVLDRNSIESKDYENRCHPISVTVRKKARFILRNNGIQFEPEWGSSQNVLVHVRDISRCLKVLQPKFKYLGYVGKRRSNIDKSPDYFFDETDLHDTLNRHWCVYPLAEELGLKFCRTHYKLAGNTVKGGEIDILTKDPNGDIVVIELKDHAVKRGNETPLDQLQRYMNSPQLREMAGEMGCRIRGLLVAQSYSRQQEDEMLDAPPSIDAYVIGKENHRPFIRKLPKRDAE